MSAEAALVVLILIGALFLVAGAIMEIASRSYRRWQDRDGDWQHEQRMKPRW